MKFLPLLLLILLIAACSDGKVDTSKLKEEMKAREIKVIPDAQIIERALTIGDSITQSLDAKVALESAGTAIKTWQDIDKAMMCRAYLIGKSYSLSDKELGVLQAYQYSAENDQSADPNVQQLSGEMMAYNAPIEQNGKIIGMWSLHLPRKYVILSMD